MGRITSRRPVTRITLGQQSARRPDTLAVEEPLEIRLAGRPFVVTMRTPGHDVELAAGFLVSEGIVRRVDDLLTAIHCGGPGTGGPGGGAGLRAADDTGGGAGPGGTSRERSEWGRAADQQSQNTYNVLDVALAAGAAPPPPEAARSFYTTSSCGVCGKVSIDAVEAVSSHDVAADPLTIDADLVATFPDRLREHQGVFDKTGGLHAAALFDGATGELLVVREDVGRHNAVDKVVGWALLDGRLPLTGTVLQVSGRASFELVQKAAMAGIPMLSAVSAPSSLAVELAEARGLTLAGFVRGASMNVYTRPDRIVVIAEQRPTVAVAG